MEQGGLYPGAVRLRLAAENWNGELQGWRTPGMASKVHQIPTSPSFLHSEVGCQGVVLGQAVRFTNALRIRTGGAL